MLVNLVPCYRYYTPVTGRHVINSTKPFHHLLLKASARREIKIYGWGEVNPVFEKYGHSNSDLSSYHMHSNFAFLNFIETGGGEETLPPIQKS